MMQFSLIIFRFVECILPNDAAIVFWAGDDVFAVVADIAWEYLVLMPLE